jgi:hypothetical protein
MAHPDPGADAEERTECCKCRDDQPGEVEAERHLAADERNADNRLADLRGGDDPAADQQPYAGPACANGLPRRLRRSDCLGRVHATLRFVPGDAGQVPPPDPEVAEIMVGQTIEFAQCATIVPSATA